MKNFSGLQAYSSTTKLKGPAAFAKTNTPNPINKNNSSRNIGLPTQRNHRKPQNAPIRSKVTERLSRSIEEVPIYEERDMFGQFSNGGYGHRTYESPSRKKQAMLIQNCEEPTENPINQSNELYGSSYKKIDRIRNNFSLIKNKSEIQTELEDILSLIRTERQNITQKMQELQKQKEALEKKRAECSTEEKQTNTEEMIHAKEELICQDTEVQTEQLEQEENSYSMAESTSPDAQNQTKFEEQKKNNSVANNEIYQKLATMLDDMNINCKDILPDQIEISHLNFDKNYKQLTQSQIIKVQKFFIKKLSQKISC